MLDRSRVLVQDEIAGLAPGRSLTWRMHTATNVSLESPRVAILRRGDRTLRVELLWPADAAFSSRPAAPPTPRENPNRGITVLEAELPARDHASDARIAVVMTPVGAKWNPRAAPEVRPLDDWK
jgi:hypothetical protein